MVEHSQARKVGMIGVSFKPGTDDMRESPLAELAGRLISSGIGVEIYDPFVFEAYSEANSTAGRGNDAVPDLQSRLVGDLDTLIASSDAIIVGNIYKETLPELNEAALTTPIIDLARLDRSKVSGGSYAGICW
jgi:GDP-mannose 6-dehydrogenase